MFEYLYEREKLRAEERWSTNVNDCPEQNSYILFDDDGLFHPPRKKGNTPSSKDILSTWKDFGEKHKIKTYGILVYPLQKLW